MKMPKCECGEELKHNVIWTGADWNCEKGEGSGYEYELVLECEKCGRVYSLCNMRNVSDVSFRVE